MNLNRREFVRTSAVLAGIASGALPSNALLDEKIVSEAANMSQKNWRWCNKCQALFFAGNPTTGACPEGGGHDYTNSGDYSLETSSSASGQKNWRWCHKCQGLFFAGNPTTGACPAGGGHDYTNSGDYTLKSV